MRLKSGDLGDLCDLGEFFTKVCSLCTAGAIRKELYLFASPPAGTDLFSLTPVGQKEKQLILKLI